MTDDIIRRAQKRGINISQSKEGDWHGSYIYSGQEYTLDNDDAQKLLDDMEALAECLSQDDTYAPPDYNDDLDRYIITIQGSDEQFTDQVLAKAFAKAKAAALKLEQQREEERRAREAPAPEPEIIEPAKPKRARGNGPQREAAPAIVPPADLPAEIAQALIALLDTVREAIAKGSQQQPQQAPIEPFVEPVVETAPPAPRKQRGLSSSKKA